MSGHPERLRDGLTGTVADAVLDTVAETMLDVLVVGAGPAGMAAAISACAQGRKVALIDDNIEPGGQIWRGQYNSAIQHSQAAKWFEALDATSGTGALHRFFGYRVTDGARGSLQLTPTCGADARPLVLQAPAIVLATGARERFLPFPGWTLPNVMGAGGLQAMAQAGLELRGKRVVLAGSGPLLVAAAAHLHAEGAVVAAVCEQAPWSSLVRFGRGLAAHPLKAAEACAYLLRARAPFWHSTYPLRAEGDGRLERVVLRRGAEEVTLACDYLGCGFHLVPNLELAQLLGCEVVYGSAEAGPGGDSPAGAGSVETDSVQQTSIPGIFCAGEAVGIGGLDTALIEGRIAGLAAAGDLTAADRLVPARDRARRFAALLERTFALPPALRSLPAPETIVCRCEDVRMSELAEHRSWRSAKLHSRCGMGACQGRICGAATAFLLGWQPNSARPPLRPVALGQLATAPHTSEAGSKEV